MKHDFHTLAAAYALDALTDTERRGFERHMAHCPTCAQEVTELRETAARLGAAAALTPPAALRDRVLAQAARTRQLPPRLSDRLRPRTALGLSWMLAAACLLIALIAGITAIDSHYRAQRAESVNRQITAVMAAPDARTVTGRAHPSGTATIITSRSVNKAVILASGMAALPHTRTYQLWFMGDGAPRSAGLLTAHGPARTLLAGPIGGAHQIGMTIEPAGGSPQPTSSPVFTVPVT